jgi:F-type H+-transporting ATPase subunit epsilon
MPGKSLMNLKILLPFGIFTKEIGVTRIVADTGSGSLGILPRRMDCVAALSPGILVYEIGEDGEVYIAVDDGILIKTGFDVLISVRNAIAGLDLKILQETVEREFLVLNEREQKVRSVMSGVEVDFIHRIAAFSHE